MKVLYVIALILGFCGLGLFVVGYFQYKIVKNLDEIGVMRKGVICDIEVNVTMEATDIVFFCFYSDGGEFLKKECFFSTNFKIYTEGEEVNLLCDPSDFNNVVINNFYEKELRYFGLFILGLFFMLPGLSIIILKCPPLKQRSK